MTCNTCEILLATRRDLSPDQEHAVRTHVQSCARCAAAWQREQRTSQLLQSLPAVQTHPAPLVTQQIRARLTRPPRRRKPQFAAAIVVALCCLILVSAVAAQAYPQQVQQAASWLGWKGFSYPEQLYLVGNARSQEGAYGGRITVIDLATREKTRVFENVVDAVVSPDQARLYILHPDGIRAVDHQTRQELWHVPLGSLGGSAMVFGPSQMAVSPDGRWLYFTRPETQHGMLQIVDTATGELQPTIIQLPNYLSPRFVTPPNGARLYILDEQMIHVLNTQTQQIERSVKVPDQWFQGSDLATIAGAMLSANGEQIYVVSYVFRLAVFDLQQQAFVEERQLPAPERISNNHVFVAGSANGTRLVVGQNHLTEPYAMGNGTVIQPDTDVPSEMAVYDTRTWQPVQQIPFDRPIETIAVDPVGAVVYAIAGPASNEPQTVPQVFGGNTVVVFDTATGQIRAKYTREGEEIVHLFMGP